jgi:hypothetical protein
MVPQAPAPELLHATDHVTPAFDVSFLTVAESWLVASGVRAVGVALKTTEIEEAAVIVAVTFAAIGVALSVAVAVALMVTGFTPLAVEGAVYVATAPDSV